MKLEMNRAWNDALRLVSVSRDVILVVAGVFFFLPYFAFSVIAPDPLTQMGAKASTDTALVMARLEEFYSGYWWVILLIVIMQAIGMLGLLALLTDHRRPTVAQALKIGARKMISYLVAYILLGLILATAFLLLGGLAALSGAGGLVAIILLLALICWAFLFVRFSLVGPILVKEDVASPLTALGRSWTLTSGNGGRLFAFFFLLFVAYGVVAMVVSLVSGALFGLFGPQTAQFGDALVVSVMNAGWATVFLAILAAVHDQFAGPSPATLSATFE